MKEKRKNAIQYGILIIIALLFILPLIWVVLASVDSNASDALRWPTQWTLGNYIEVLSSKSNLQGFGIGLLISGVQAFMVVILAGMISYPLSRHNIRYKGKFMYVILFMTALPTTAVIVPVYKLYLSFGLYDSVFGLILFLISAALPYGIWLMKNFTDDVPTEIEEAARIDGATTLQCITRIVVPLMFPGICTVFIYTFTNSWGNFFIPYILLNSGSKLPAAVRLYQYFGQHGTVVYGSLAAYSCIYALPSVLLYIFAQKYMSRGFTMSGAAKG